MRNEAEAAKLVPSVSLREITMNPTLRIPLVISLMMMMAQQLSGINAVRTNTLLPRCVLLATVLMIFWFPSCCIVLAII